MTENTPLCAIFYATFYEIEKQKFFEIFVEQEVSKFVIDDKQVRQLYAKFLWEKIYPLLKINDLGNKQFEFYFANLP